MKNLKNFKYIILIMVISIMATNVNALNIVKQSNYNNKYNLIYATGRIHSGDLYRLKRAFNSLPKNRQTIVVFNSTGGELDEGMKIGRYIYNHKIATAVQNNSICASSCAIAFLGGRDLYGRKMMILPSSSKLGYHSFYYKSSKKVSVSKIQNDLSHIVDYFSYVQAPNNLMSKMLNTKSSSMYWITQHSNRMLKLRKGIRLKSSYVNNRTNKKRKKQTITYDNYNNQEDALKKYFSSINKAITSNSGYSYNNVALNNTTTYKFWLEANLNYVHLQKIRRIKSNMLEAKVIYSLKNGSKVYSKNRYILAKNSQGWQVVSKRVTPYRSSNKIVRSIKNKLP